MGAARALPLRDCAEAEADGRNRARQSAFPLARHASPPSWNARLRGAALGEVPPPAPCGAVCRRIPNSRAVSQPCRPDPALEGRASNPTRRPSHRELFREHLSIYLSIYLTIYLVYLCICLHESAPARARARAPGIPRGSPAALLRPPAPYSPRLSGCGDIIIIIIIIVHMIIIYSIIIIIIISCIIIIIISSSSSSSGRGERAQAGGARLPESDPLLEPGARRSCDPP